MSRKAKMPIPVPKGVEAKIEGNLITLKGPKGTLKRNLEHGVKASLADGKITLVLEKPGSETNFLGLLWALVDNMVTGVATGYEKKLEMIGVGYRAAVQGQLLDLQLGLSHPTKLPIPEGIKVAVEKNTMISITGTDKQLVGQFAATIRSKKKPEPYKGKGIRYLGEHVRKKAGKAGKAGKK
jgi:large subunit ribosomal protein L6